MNARPLHYCVCLRFGESMSLLNVLLVYINKKLIIFKAILQAQGHLGTWVLYNMLHRNYIELREIHKLH